MRSAQRCTLEVTFSAEEAVNLLEWRLVWLAEAAPAGHLRVVPEEGADATTGVCDLRRDRDGESGARIDTARFCGVPGSPSPSVAIRYVLDVPAATPARIAILPVFRTDGGPSIGVAGIGEATINGGLRAAYPPVVAEVRFVNGPDATTYHLRGAFLEGIRAAHVFHPTSGAAIPMRVLSRSAGAAELLGPLLEQVDSGVLEVRDQNGRWTAIPIEWAGSGLKRTVAPRLGVRIDRNALRKPGSSDAGGGVTVAPELSDALAREGVASLLPLDRLKPGEVPELSATNILGEPIQPRSLEDWFVATLALDADVPGVLKRVSATPGVGEAFHDAWRYMAHTTPDDSLFGEQWGLRNTGGTVCGYSAAYGVDIGAVSAWDWSISAPSVRVAVLDTGIDSSHPDFGPYRVRLGPSYVSSAGSSLDDNGHGTSVAGIAAAVGNNAMGVAGVAWRVLPWGVKVLDWNGGGYATWLEEGIRWARNMNIPIVNMSLGWPDGTPELGTGGRALLAAATLESFKRGHLLVASSGNAIEGYQFSPCPVDLDRRVFTVGAYLPNGSRWQDWTQLEAIDCSSTHPCQESNFGGFLDVVAPGGRLITTTALGSGGYRSLANCTYGDRSTMAFGGTSASAPFVSGIAALLLSRRPELVGEDIAQVLNRTTSGPYIGGTWEEEYGWGRVKASTALNFVEPGKIVAHWGAGPGPFSLGPLQVVDSTVIASRLFRDVPGMPSTNYTTSCVRYRLRAQLQWPFRFAPGLKGWTRSSGTLAWKDVSPYYYGTEVDTATFVAGTLDTAGVVVEAFVFRIRDAANPSQTIGWFPAEPSQAHVAFTVIGYRSTTTAGVGSDGVAARLSVTTFPNPSRGKVKMAVDVPARGHVRGLVLDLAGRRLTTLVERELEAGRHEFWWDGTTDGGSHCAAGVYFCRIDCGGISTMKRFIRLGGSR